MLKSRINRMINNNKKIKYGKNHKKLNLMKKMSRKKKVILRDSHKLKISKKIKKIKIRITNKKRKKYIRKLKFTIK